MKTRTILEYYGIIAGITILTLLLGTYIQVYFFEGLESFVVDFNDYNEAIPEMLLFTIGIIGLILLLVRKVKQRQSL